MTGQELRSQQPAERSTVCDAGCVIKSRWSLRCAWSVASIDSVASAASIRSIGSFASILSIGSSGSVLSVGSAGSILSVGSAGSILSFASEGSILGWQSSGAILHRLDRRMSKVELAQLVAATTAVGVSAAILSSLATRLLRQWSA